MIQRGINSNLFFMLGRNRFKFSLSFFRFFFRLLRRKRFWSRFYCSWGSLCSLGSLGNGFGSGSGHGFGSGSGHGQGSGAGQGTDNNDDQNLGQVLENLADRKGADNQDDGGRNAWLDAEQQGGGRDSGGAWTDEPKETPPTDDVFGGDDDGQGDDKPGGGLEEGGDLPEPGTPDEAGMDQHDAFDGPEQL